MAVTTPIEAYIASQPESKRGELRQLHQRILETMPQAKLWFLDGKNDAGKVVSNPNIGYGSLTLRYADESSREFYQIGLSANTAGISVYIMGIADKTYLPAVYGTKLGKANVTGYCIKFKRLADIDIQALETAIRDGIQRTTP